MWAGRPRAVGEAAAGPADVWTSRAARRAARAAPGATAGMGFVAVGVVAGRGDSAPAMMPGCVTGTSRKAPGAGRGASTDALGCSGVEAGGPVDNPE